MQKVKPPIYLRIWFIIILIIVGFLGVVATALTLLLWLIAIILVISRIRWSLQHRKLKNHYKETSPQYDTKAEAIPESKCIPLEQIEETASIEPTKENIIKSFEETNSSTIENESIPESLQNTSEPLPAVDLKPETSKPASNTALETVYAKYTKPNTGNSNRKKYATWKLTGTSKRDRQEVLELSVEGEEVYIDYDYEAEKYVVTNTGCEEIGYLSKSAAQKFETDIESGDHEYEAEIESLELNDNDKYQASITVYLIGCPDYEYTDVHIVGTKFLDDLSPIEQAKINDVVFLVPEPDNQYDEAAIMVHNAAGQKLGYVAKGFIQDITNDFLRREDTIHAKISSKNEHGLSMNMEFYRDGKGR